MMIIKLNITQDTYIKQRIRTAKHSISNLETK